MSTKNNTQKQSCRAKVKYLKLVAYIFIMQYSNIMTIQWLFICPTKDHIEHFLVAKHTMLGSMEDIEMNNFLHLCSLFSCFCNDVVNILWRFIRQSSVKDDSLLWARKWPSPLSIYLSFVCMYLSLLSLMKDGF